MVEGADVDLVTDIEHEVDGVLEGGVEFFLEFGDGAVDEFFPASFCGDDLVIAEDEDAEVADSGAEGWRGTEFPDG